jgi:hypothetical protein
MHLIGNQLLGQVLDIFTVVLLLVATLRQLGDCRHLTGYVGSHQRPGQPKACQTGLIDCHHWPVKPLSGNPSNCLFRICRESRLRESPRFRVDCINRVGFSVRVDADGGRILHEASFCLWHGVPVFDVRAIVA